MSKNLVYTLTTLSTIFQEIRIYVQDAATFVLNCVSKTALCTTKWLTYSQYKKVYYIIKSWYLKVFIDFLKVFIAIAANTNSIDTILFDQIVESSCFGDRVLCDDSCHKIAAGVNFLKNHFLEKEKKV